VQARVILTVIVDTSIITVVLNLPRVAGGNLKTGALNNPAKEVISLYHAFFHPSSGNLRFLESFLKKFSFSLQAAFSILLASRA